MARFVAGPGSPKTPTAEATPRPPQVRYKRLNIDVTFDPLDPRSVADIRQLFTDQLIKNSTEGDTLLISPFDFELTTPYSAGYPLRPKRPATSGLFFRETTPVQLVFRQNSTGFRSAVIKTTTRLREEMKLYEAQKAQDRTGLNAANAASKAAQAQQQIDEKARADAKTDEDKTAAQSRIDQDKANDAAAKADIDKYGAALTTGSNAITARKTALKLLYDSAAATTISRAATFIKAIPNPDRVFSFNLARSAFVQNKKMDLTISNGLLTKVSINKPSEVEGFSEIPLELSKKLAELPKDILTLRTQTTTPNTAKNTVNAQTARAATEPAALLQTQTDQIKAEADKLEAETKLIQAQRALQGAINGQ